MRRGFSPMTILTIGKASEEYLTDYQLMALTQLDSQCGLKATKLLVQIQIKADLPSKNLIHGLSVIKYLKIL